MVSLRSDNFFLIRSKISEFPAIWMSVGHNFEGPIHQYIAGARVGYAYIGRSRTNMMTTAA